LSVSIVEVAPRDGLQIEPRVLPPAIRAELVDRLGAAGLRRIEAASFVSAERVPTMAGAEEVAALIGRRSGVRLAGLALNDRGYQRLARTGLIEVRVAVACTESFSQANTGMSVAAAASMAERIVAAAHADRRTASVTLAVAFGCPFDGAVDATAVTALAERMLAAGADELLFADTIGVGMPGQVRQLVYPVATCGVPVGVHLHDTRNTAVVNAFAAMEAGATVFDASVGGVGGCPFAPGATGNVATEDLVYLFHREGIDTGIDLDALIAVARWLPEILGHPVTGSVQRAGAPLLGRLASA
jgi:isopropylmalate/homocitrate/citramalate synthase